MGRSVLSPSIGIWGHLSTIRCCSWHPWIFHLFSFLSELPTPLLIPVFSSAPLRGEQNPTAQGTGLEIQVLRLQLWSWPSLAVGESFPSVSLSFHIYIMVTTSVPIAENDCNSERWQFTEPGIEYMLSKCSSPSALPSPPCCSSLSIIFQNSAKGSNISKKIP